MSSPAVPAASASRLRLTLAFAVVVIVGVVVAVNTVLERLLSDGRIIDLGIVELRLTHNSGVAFGFAAGLPTWAVLAVTSAIAVGVAIFAWKVVGTMSTVGRIGLVAVIAGAVANIVDRAPDGVVTDYVHTGWFATFNLADSLITCGAVALVWAVWRDENSHGGDESGAAERTSVESASGDSASERSIRAAEPTDSAEPGEPVEPVEPAESVDSRPASPARTQAPAGEELERS